MSKKTKLKKEFDQSDQQKLIDLVDELTPRISHEQAASLLKILADAQANPPTDKKAFVDRVNRVFDIYRVRLCTGDGDAYRLKFQPGSTKRGYIYLFSGKNKKICNSYRDVNLSLVDVSQCFHGNIFDLIQGVDFPALAVDS